MEELVKLPYYEHVRSHHPKSIMYWVTEGIIIDDERYPIEEFRLKDDGLYAIISKNDREYFEVFLSKYDDSEILSQLEELDDINRRLTAEEQKVDNDTKYTAGNGLTLTGTEFSIDDSKLATQEELDDINRRLTAEEQKVDKDTTYTAGDGISISDEGVISLTNTTDNDNQTLSFDNNTRSLSISGGNQVTIPDNDTTYKGRKNIIIDNNTNFVTAKEFIEYTSSIHYLRSPISPSGGTVIKQGLEGNSIQFIDHKDGNRYIKIGVYYMKVTDMASAFGWSQPTVDSFITAINTVLSADNDPNTPYRVVTLRGNTRFTYEDRADVYVNKSSFVWYDMYIHRLNNSDYEFKYELVGKVAGLDTSYITGYIKDIRDKSTYPTSIMFTQNGGSYIMLTKDNLYSAVSTMKGVVKTFNTHYIYVDPNYTLFSLP